MSRLLAGPSDGLTLDLTAAGDGLFWKTVDQTIVLTRADKLVLFVASLSIGKSRLPDLSKDGIRLTDAGVVCEVPVQLVLGRCGFRRHAVRVTWEGAEAQVSPSMSATLGELHFTNSGVDDATSTGACDAKSSSVVGGFVAAAVHPLY